MTTLANQSRYWACWMKYAMSSLSTFSLITLYLFGVRFYFFYHTALCLGFILSLWTIISEVILGISNAIHANISTFLHRKDSNSSWSWVFSDNLTCIILVSSLTLSVMEINYLANSSHISSFWRSSPSIGRASKDFFFWVEAIKHCRVRCWSP